MLATKHESETAEWFKNKVDRITVSNVKIVYTPYQMLLKEPNSCDNSVVSLVMNYDDFNLTVAYGMVWVWK